jgi:uncharacterized protein YqeY
MTTIAHITASTTAALKAKDSQRVQTLRLVTAAIKQYQVDNRGEEVDEAKLITILNRMVKQRQESITQFTAANRMDLVAVEERELAVIKEFLPQEASQEEIEKVIADAITKSGATTVKDMGKVMAIVKTELNGKADMSKVSASIKSRLS